MRQIGLVLVLCLAVLAGPSWAQEAPALEVLEISLWPEFDRPDMLVIYRGFFAEGRTLPVPVDIRIPASVGAPTAVAFVDEAGERLNQQYTTRLDGDALVVSFELPTLGFQLEYYDTLSKGADAQREYAYTYTADYAIEALTVKFQVPPTATAYTVQPAADAVAPADGLLYHVVQAGSVNLGESMSWLLSYTKADSTLTVSAFAESQQPMPTPAVAPVSGDSSTTVVFVISFVALVGVGAGAFWLGRRTQPPPGEAAPASRRRSSPSPGRRSAQYCHKCGAQLRADSDFCHRCGAEVRER
ncbi:MAG: zinc ribbon domain-containing protein [Anaerolineae bacterium]